ncbi:MULTISPECIES: HNH endonuclease [unclassified Brevibacterium]|uniref:HNH endonuclease n=1 Tax=unclassified Brevibacterium TaxID=2614124 RepID=UPI0015869BAC|nr:HNH endonuclease [Brevibacterium sp. CS2]MCK1802969.1 HNH endonuclease [Brevibacterium sp. R8603A2]
MLEERSDKIASGCWEWQGVVDSRGYGRIGFNRAGQFLPHRLALEAKLGKPLGELVAHHVCANPRCTNPDHLEPVTQAQNLGEMMARSNFLARIKELEDALRELNPNHPLLPGFQ